MKSDILAHFSGWQSNTLFRQEKYMRIMKANRSVLSVMLVLGSNLLLFGPEMCFLNPLDH